MGKKHGEQNFNGHFNHGEMRFHGGIFSRRITERWPATNFAGHFSVFSSGFFLQCSVVLQYTNLDITYEWLGFHCNLIDVCSESQRIETLFLKQAGN